MRARCWTPRCPCVVEQQRSASQVDQSPNEEMAVKLSVPRCCLFRARHLVLSAFDHEEKETYRATRYCMILPLSNSRIGLPSSHLSVSAGIRPLGLISRNHGSFCAFFENSILCTLYGILISISVSHVRYSTSPSPRSCTPDETTEEDVRQGSGLPWLVAFADLNTSTVSTVLLNYRLSRKGRRSRARKSWLVEQPKRHRSRKRGKQVRARKRDLVWKTYPSSSNVMEILIPLGVCVVYSVMSEVSAMVLIASFATGLRVLMLFSASGRNTGSGALGTRCALTRERCFSAVPSWLVILGWWFSSGSPLLWMCDVIGPPCGVWRGRSAVLRNARIAVLRCWHVLHEIAPGVRSCSLC